MAEHEHMSVWKRFWEKGGWWRSLLIVVGYYALDQLGATVFVPLLLAEGSDPAMAVLVGTAMPIALGCVILLVFAWSVGWLRELFGPQPIRGRGWMWIAVGVVVFFNALHFATIDYAEAGAGIVIAWLVAGLCIGFAEETLTRGFVVNLMRKRGYPEILVAVVSAGLFAMMHLGNLLTGQALFPTLLQFVYTFGFGILMYLALRVTGNLIWPILLHATTDPSIFLQTAYPTEGALSSIAGLGNPVVTITGIVLLIFIRGKVAQPQADTGLVEPGTAVPGR